MKKKLIVLMLMIGIIASHGICKELDWEQVGSDGYDDATNKAIFPGGVIEGSLYVGTERAQEDGGAQVYRSSDGEDFDNLTDDGFGDDYNTQILPAFQAFDGTIFAWTTNTSGAEIWSSENGSSWNQVVNGTATNGLNGNMHNVKIWGEVIKESMSMSYEIPACMYIGVENTSGGCSVWMTYDGIDWYEDGTAMYDFSTHTCEWLAAPGSFFNNRVFFGTYHNCGPDYVGGLYSSASPWTTVTMTGFDDPYNIMIAPARQSFNGYLYAGTWNTYGAQIWRSKTGDPDDWKKVLDFCPTAAKPDDANCTFAGSFSAPGDGFLYVAVRNSVTGVEIWRTEDGTEWKQINEDGFGDETNSEAYLAPEPLGDSLFAGTYNAGGAQLWRVRIMGGEEVEEIPEVTEDEGDVVVVGSTERKGTINPDKGDKVEIQFKGKKKGKYTLRIFTLLGELVYDETQSSLANGKFSWIPEDIASGIYIVHVEGPGVDIHKKVAILR
ncbi:T9SS type A sorting domain-containing protein [Elusimicrobiota bacterium]